MPGQRGTETRIRNIVVPTRWSDEEHAQLRSIAEFSGCSRAETLRRLVRRAGKQIIASRALNADVRRLGNNLNQIARALNEGSPVSAQDLIRAYADLLKAAGAARQ